MSSTVTASQRPETRIEIPPEVAAARDLLEEEWLTPQEFAADRSLGWYSRDLLQKAAGTNACGLKDARRERTRKVVAGSERIIWEYPKWRIKRFLKHGMDGSPPGPRRRARREIRFVGDPAVDQLAAMTGMKALQVLHHVREGQLKAVLHPTEDRILFLDAESALLWIERQAGRDAEE
jgi:hypothetical protein